MKTKSKFLKLSTFTDESGQDTNGRVFIVCTVVVESELIEKIENELERIEKKSCKNEKWFESGDKRRFKYIKLIAKSKILDKVSVYFSEYSNKTDYSKLIGGHIAKVLINDSWNKPYKVKIFIDKTTNKVLKEIVKEIKLFKIRYQKIRGISEKSNLIMRFADACCGMIRDLGKKNQDYKKLFRKFKGV